MIDRAPMAALVRPLRSGAWGRPSPPKTAFHTLLGIDARISLVTYDMLIKPGAQG